MRNWTICGQSRAPASIIDSASAMPTSTSVKPRWERRGGFLSMTIMGYPSVESRAENLDLHARHLSLLLRKIVGDRIGCTGAVVAQCDRIELRKVRLHD